MTIIGYRFITDKYRLKSGSLGHGLTINCLSCSCNACNAFLLDIMISHGGKSTGVTDNNNNDGAIL